MSSPLHSRGSSIPSSTMRVETQRYLLAQYAADGRRMETRNFGVILWASGKAACRFLTEDDVVELVADLSVYKRWVGYWQKIVTSPEFSNPGERPVSRNDPQFVDELLKTQKGNYLLFDAGFVAESVGPSQVGSVVDQLFGELVLTKKHSIFSVELEHDSLQSTANRALESSGVTSRDDFVSSYRIACKMFGVEQDMNFNYAIASESPHVLFQRVPIRQQSVFGTAAMFDCVVSSKKIQSKRHCASLIDVPPEDQGKPSVNKALRMLRKVSEVVNLSDRESAAEQIRGIALAA